MSRRASFFAVSMALLVLALGCSGSAGTVAPDVDTGYSAGAEHEAGAHRVIWGLWSVVGYPGTGQIEAVPVRGPQMHVQVNNFLEAKPGFLKLKVVDESQIFTTGDYITDVTLTHPFPGLDQYTGFDVQGVFLHNGSTPLASDPFVQYAAEGKPDETLLLNADGYTRWFNYPEFTTYGTLFGFIKGKLANLPNPSATLNPYKYFADGLDATDATGEVTLPEWLSGQGNLDNRAVFRTTSSNTRRYHLKFPLVGGVPQVKFQYGVFANWVEPDKSLGDPNLLEVPGDFPRSANSAEAFAITVTQTKDLWWESASSYGGKFILDVEVFDWGALWNPEGVPSEVGRIIIEAPFLSGGFVEMDASALPAPSPGSSSCSSVWHIEISNCQPQGNGNFDGWVIVESKEPSTYYSGFAGFDYPEDAVLSAYLRTSFAVLSESGIPTELDPIGNLTLSTGRTGVTPSPVTGLTLSWNDIPKEAEYAIYVDQNPYSGMPSSGLNDNMEFLAAVPANTTSYVHNASSPIPFSANKAYCYEVRARAVAGNPAYELSKSELAFAELENFEGGTGAGGGTWVSRSYDPAIQYTEGTSWVLNGTTSFSVSNIQLGFLGTNDTNWINIQGPQLPTVPNYSAAEFQFCHQHLSTMEMVNQFYGKMVGTSSVPFNNGQSQLLEFDLVTEQKILHSSFNYDTLYSWTGWGSPFYATWGVDTQSGGDFTCNYCGHLRWLPNGITSPVFSAFDMRVTIDGPGGYDNGDRYFGISAARPAQVTATVHSFIIDDIAVLIY